MNKSPNKKNDTNWCMQFIAPIFGIISLIMGFITTSGFWENFKEYYMIYLGVVWLLIGFIHRLRWIQKNALINALCLRSTQTETNGIKEAEQAASSNR